MFAVIELLLVGVIVVDFRIVWFRIYTTAFGFLFVHVLVIDGFFGPTHAGASLGRGIELENERRRILARRRLSFGRGRRGRRCRSIAGGHQISVMQ